MTNIFVLLILCSIAIQCVEIKKEIYYEIPSKSISHCVRRLNSTSTIGCSSKSDGNVGIIEVAFNDSDFNNRLALLKANTIMVINTNLFVRPNITERLSKSPFITGLIIFEQDNCNSSFYDNCVPQSFSEDYEMPNKLYSRFINTTFNPPGTEYAFKNWPFPVALIGKRYVSEQEKILSCYKKYNLNPTSNRRCALEIMNFMAAVRSGNVCLQYQNIQDRFAGLFHHVYFCEDFTGVNYMVNTIKNIKSRAPESVIVLISRLDSLSMFEKSAVNVHGTVTSASLLLSVMKLLMSQKEFKNPDQLNKDVLFLFLDNESYDYLGSNRFLIDIQSGEVAKRTGVPIRLSHFDLLLEFGELGFVNFSDINFFYPSLGKEENNKTLKYLRRLGHFYEKFGFQNNYTMENLPPSSVQYFLREKLMPAIVMADHRDKFRNSFYNSFLDSKSTKNNSKELLAIVNAVASFVFQEATGKNLTRLMSESDLATPFNIIQCFTKNIRCDLLKKVLTTKTIEDLHSIGFPIPAQPHSATKEISNDYRFSYLLNNLMIYLSGQEVNNSMCQDCPKCANLSSILSGNDTHRCYITQIETVNEFSLTSLNRSFWVNSAIVDQQSIRMFVQAPNTPLLISGIVVTLVMTLFMILVQSRMSEIFQCDL